ncbi:HAD-IC family P-type ATPase, partial [Candidatus Uhrbacteria bacterium]|nr:HAD-IC family P-type ATPase [Candidatus Uhrbacteria bacterium]
MSSQILWHAQTSQEAISTFRSSNKGLMRKEIAKRRVKHGWNELPKEKPLSWQRVLFRQIASPLILVLISAAVASALFSEWIDAGVIFAAIFINTLIGFIQELKSSRALTSLQALVQPLALVLRDEKEIEIPAREVVPGDILILRLGDQISADARLIENFDLQVNESILTGESLPIEKQIRPLDKGTALAERTNMLYGGTMVVGGHGKAVVVATGFQTEIGKIAALISETKETKTPLQIQLSHLARNISLIVICILVVLFLVGLITGHGVFEMFEISVALAVAAIPEGLAVSVTIVLAIGMQRILRRRSLVRRLVAAETLGSVSVICSDKTGTITEGNMRVVSVVANFEMTEAFDLRGQTHRGIMLRLLETIVFCNDAKIANGKNGEVMRGSATEIALLKFAMDVGVDPNTLQKNQRLADIPFDSVRKFMVVENASDGAFRLSLKGAPSKVLAFCDLSPTEHARWEKQVDDLAKQGLRLIAVATKTIRQKREHITTNDLFGFEFLGLIALADPLRVDAKEQIAAALRAGIRTVLVTGDHPLTARAIAKQTGLPSEPENIAVGSQLDQWSDEELARRVSRIRIYARVEPRHKIRIVTAWKERGEVVAMT